MQDAAATSGFAGNAFQAAQQGKLTSFIDVAQGFKSAKVDAKVDKIAQAE